MSSTQFTSRCASRSTAISYGKAPHFQLISACPDASLRACRVYGALTWRAIWNARHVSDLGAILHAINRAAILGVNVACNTIRLCDGLPANLATDLP